MHNLCTGSNKLSFMTDITKLILLNLCDIERLRVLMLECIINVIQKVGRDHCQPYSIYPHAES
jgi:hypothetical protein